MTKYIKKFIFVFFCLRKEYAFHQKGHVVLLENHAKLSSILIYDNFGSHSYIDYDM